MNFFVTPTDEKKYQQLTGKLLPWMEISGSPFEVYTSGTYPFLYYMDITNSCLGSDIITSPRDSLLSDRILQ